MKRNLFYFGLEPLKARYTYQLCKEWMPKTFEKYSDKLNFIDVEGDFDPDCEIKVGAVLDAIGRGKYSLSQCQNFLQMLYDDKVQDGDIIFLQDFWTPGLEAIWYALDLYGYKDVKVTGYTDSTGDEKYNLMLARARANSVAYYLEGLGLRKIRSFAMGEKDLIRDEWGREIKEKSRRVEICIKKD